MWSDILLLVVGLLVTIDVVAVLTLVFFERRDPESVLAWMFTVLTLPIAGFVLYLIFGFKYFKTRAFGEKSTGDQVILARVRGGRSPRSAVSRRTISPTWSAIPSSPGSWWPTAPRS